MTKAPHNGIGQNSLALAPSALALVVLIFRDPGPAAAARTGLDSHGSDRQEVYKSVLALAVPAPVIVPAPAASDCFDTAQIVLGACPRPHGLSLSDARRLTARMANEVAPEAAAGADAPLRVGAALPVSFAVASPNIAVHPIDEALVAVLVPVLAACAYAVVASPAPANHADGPVAVDAAGLLRRVKAEG